MKKSSLRVGIVVPHIFMQDSVLPQVIFSPGHLAANLAEGLVSLGIDVTLFTPGPFTTKARNVTADTSYFESELAGRNDTYIDLLKKHPLTFITLARQVQAEIISKVFAAANNDELDIVHVYTNEEDTALPFAQFCRKPVLFTHHDPFNFLVRYKNLFPKYPALNWLSVSFAQRETMPPTTNWIGNIYHGLDESLWQANYGPRQDYVLYLGRIIEAKGVHLAIAAVKEYNRRMRRNGKPPLALKIAGKHYSGGSKDAYWQEHIQPELDDPNISYVGYAADNSQKQNLLGNAKALLVPSLFDEPFGMVMVEALATGTPVVGIDSGAIGEIIKNGRTGFVVSRYATSKPMSSGSLADERTLARRLAGALQKLNKLNRRHCRDDLEARFTLRRMCSEHQSVYQKLVKNSK